MNLKSDQVIEDLIERTLLHIAQAKKISALPIEKLNWKANAESWSVLECFEHLNLYGDFYIPEITNQIERSKTIPKENFKPGFLGNYFAKTMLPKNPIRKMKTFKDKNPIGSKLDALTLNRFIFQQEQIVALLEKAKHIDLSKTKTAISISKIIKLKLGDTFRVVVYHNLRHIAQANRVLDLQD